MTEPKEIPQLASELVDLSKEYLRQETIDPARRLARAVGLYVLAGALFSFGGIMLSIAALRIINEALPRRDLWTAFGFVITALLVLIAAGSVVYTAVRVTHKDGTE
jgi:hypothetical protein